MSPIYKTLFTYSLCFLTWYNHEHGVSAARILGAFPITSYSHQIVYRRLLKELHVKGHDIVIMTPDPTHENLTNYKEIDLHYVYEHWRKALDFADSREKQGGVEAIMSAIWKFAEVSCDLQLSHPEVQKMIAPNSNEHFDLVIVEWLVNPCMTAFAHRFNAPLIGISSLPTLISGFDTVGNPTHPAYCPDVFLPYSDHMSFTQRLHSVIYSVWFRYKWHTMVLPGQQRVAEKYFGHSLAYLGDIEKNVSLILQNSHPVLNYPRPMVPAVVEFAGLSHIREPKPLPEDLLEWLEGAPAGVIYFSLGSNVRSDRMPEHKRQMFLDAFSELPQRVLWKWESDTLPGQPKNVKAEKWLPQQDILAHPKIRVFITQGGLQSMEEAMMYGVPLIGMPFFADQDVNVNKIIDLGVGVKLDLNSLSKAAILEAINIVLRDTSYSANAKQVHQLIQDQPEVSGMARAVWWTEYVLRHKGARHLRSAVVDMPFYQYLLLDVITFIVLTLVTLALVIITVVKAIWKLGRKLKRE